MDSFCWCAIWYVRHEISECSRVKVNRMKHESVFISLGFRCIYVELSEDSIRSVSHLVSRHDVLRQSLLHDSHVHVARLQRQSTRMCTFHATARVIRRARRGHVHLFVDRTALHLRHHRRVRPRGLHHYHDHAASLQHPTLVYILRALSQPIGNHRHHCCLRSRFSPYVQSIQKE